MSPVVEMLNVSKPDNTEAAASEPIYSFSSLEIDLLDLSHLLVTLRDLISEQPFERDGERDEEMDRIAALSRISSDLAARLSQNVTKHHRTIREFL